MYEFYMKIELQGHMDYMERTILCLKI